VDRYRMPRFFPTKDDALKLWRSLIEWKSNKLFVVEIKGNGNFAVIDLKTARDLGLSYDCSDYQFDRTNEKN
jgi:hypothetical protein